MALNDIDPVDSHVGRRIRARRNAIGQTQQELSGQIGLTFQQVQKYERGANRVSASMLFHIARAQKTPVAWYFEGLDEDGASFPAIAASDGIMADHYGARLTAAFLELDAPFRSSFVEIGENLVAATKATDQRRAA